MPSMGESPKPLGTLGTVSLDGLHWEAARKAVEVVRYQPRQLDLVLACGAGQPEVPSGVARWLVDARSSSVLRRASAPPPPFLPLVAAQGPPLALAPGAGGRHPCARLVAGGARPCPASGPP